MSKLDSNDVLFELGAGIGAVTFPAAREKGAASRAVEIEPLRVLILRMRRALSRATGPDRGSGTEEHVRRRPEGRDGCLLLPLAESNATGGVWRRTPT